MSLIGELFGKSPFGPLVEHTRKVHECVKLVRPLLDACVREDWEGIHRLQDRVVGERRGNKNDPVEATGAAQRGIHIPGSVRRRQDQDT